MNDTTHLADLRARFNGGEQLDYVFFWGHEPSLCGINDACLSQWYESPFEIDGHRYLTAEHFMMAEKAALFGDQDMRHKILKAQTPASAKALGRRVRGFSEVVWCQNRFYIVVRANKAKFSQDVALRRYLLGTGSRILAEASPADPIWGIGLEQQDSRSHNPNEWRGLNLLGFALMRVRAHLA